MDFRCTYLEPPVDEDDYRFIKSFNANQISNPDAINFFDEYGFIVVRDVLTREECQMTIDEMFSYIEKNYEGFDRNNLNTWEKWPDSSYGMPSKKPQFTPQILKNRQNPNIYNVYSSLLGTPNVLVNHDRWAIYRPTKLVGDKYKTKENIHLDICPMRFAENDPSIWPKVDNLAYNDVSDFMMENNHVTISDRGRQLQSILNLVDNEENDGGLIIVPGFHKQFSQWLRTINKLTSDECKYSINNNSIKQNAIRITCRAGSLVIWDQRCIHGSKPNHSERMRCVQFMKIFSAEKMPAKRSKARKNAIVRELKSINLLESVTDVGKIVFGLN
ncbi:MAG: phytanoyl-CoA dioxygenase family protein [Satyrvirus sp.]|uniref:Phytanoyl-CoA dioxygenase family protein n=1 Tax=Satyrvirus sp. TaxID=2487771 RepID=A0A3G5AEB2_9VIRU|nr:MAG: phytanoyl-CoA dioxygenase family protein [Satyrvirus sp.]